ncbi:MAG: hypothetical protein EOP53_10375 [Sphingobacteriales bacterium]|nr:MAG: hypothetical protein EOP53_10375 [Sphingobacteriales bacterium]
MLLILRRLSFSLYIFLVLFLVSCDSESGKNQNKTPHKTQNSAEKPIAIKWSSAKMIIPGKSIGLTHLYESADSVFLLLGKPDSSDAAMGKMMASWYKNNHETHIFFGRKMGSEDETSRVKQIRITSSYFVTEKGVSVGSAIHQIQMEFPELKIAGSYISPQTHLQTTIYDDLQKGIAFETDAKNGCVGITVHKPNQQSYEIYNALYKVKME